MENQQIGRVEAVMQDRSGGDVAKLTIHPKYRPSFTHNTRFIIVPEPGSPDGHQVVVQPGIGGTAATLADEDRVEAERPPEPLFPLGEIIKGVAEGLGILSGQLESFRNQLQRLPQSPEAQKLREEWLRVQEELKKTQAITEDTVRREMLPRVQKEMDDLDKRFKDLQAKMPPAPAP
jgi:hypothetical protein